MTHNADCVCGHRRATHFRDTGNCMLSTESETWACDCHEYRPAQFEVRDV